MKTWDDVYQQCLKRGYDHVWAEHYADQYMENKGFTKCKCGRFYKTLCEYCHSNTFNGDMLLIGRQMRGLTHKKLSEMSGISTRKLSDLENGAHATTEDVEALAKALSFPVKFFYQRGRIAEKETWQLQCRHKSY